MSRQLERPRTTIARTNTSHHLFAIPSRLLLLAAAFCALPQMVRGQTLTWDPANLGALGSDGTGFWDFSASQWFNSATTSDTFWVNGADAVIGAGGNPGPLTSSSPITLDSGGPVVVNSITFNSLGASSTTGYTIVDSTGATGTNPLQVAASNALTITNNAAGVTTSINANIVSQGANAFTLNVLGTGNLTVGGSIGISATPNNASGSLRVGSSPGSGYTGTLTLGAANKLSGVTINSGAVALTNPASLGSGTVTLSGGALNIVGPSPSPSSTIGINIAADGGTVGSSTGEQPERIGSTATAGVVPMSNWNDFVITRFRLADGNHSNTTAPPANQGSNVTSTVPFTLKDSTGATSSAQVSAWQGSNTFSVYNGSNPQTQTNPNAQLENGLIGSSTTFPAKVGVTGVPYLSYNAYVYFNNNTANQNAQISLTSGSYTSSTYYVKTQGPISTANYVFTDGSSSTTANSFLASNYVVIPVPLAGTNGATNSFTVALTAGAGNPGICAVEIVPTSSTITNPLAITASSSINLAVPTLATGGMTISGGATLSAGLAGSTTSTLFDLSPAATTFSGGGILSPATGLTMKLGTINDGGNGFGTAGSGTVLLTTDNTSTVAGPVSINGPVQLSMASTSSGSATGTGAVNIGAGGLLSGNGIVTPSAGHSITLSGGGTIRAPAAGSTLRVAGPVLVNNGGVVQSGAGTLNLTGAATINSGGNLAVGVGQLITTSAGLTLNGGTSTFTVTSTGTTSPFVNVTGGAGVSSLAVSGSNGVSILLSGNAISQPGSTTTYDLFNYAGADLAPTVSGNQLSFAGGGTLSVTSPDPSVGGLPPNQKLSLVDLAGTGGSPNQILLKITLPGPITWTGATNGNWDSATTNWATTSPLAATQFVDGSIVTFGDTNPLTSTTVTHSVLTIVPAQVNPASLTFNNNTVNYSLSGGTIGAASGGLTLNGTGSVTLNNANTLNGAVSVNGGQLILGNGTALGNSTGVTIASGGALVLNNGTNSPVTFGSMQNGSGTIPLSIAGAGLTASPAGALVNFMGNNTYAGAISLNGDATIGSQSAAAGDGLTLAGSIRTTSAGNNYTLTFAGPGNTTANGAISGGGGLTMAGVGTLTLSGANSFSGPIQVDAGGAVVATGAQSLGSTSSVTVAAGGNLTVQGGISGAMPLSLAGNGVGASPTGALTSAGGANMFTGPITLTGDTTIGSTSATAGDGLALLGGINTAANNLAFSGVGNTTVRSQISGGGRLTMNGPGSVSLPVANSYAGGTTVNSGVLAVSGSNSPLGTGGVTLAGGTLRFQMGNNVIGVNIAADGGTVGSSTGEQPELLGSIATAGVVPINHWNDFVITRFQNGGDKSNTNLPQPQSIPTSPTPFTLVNSAGATTAAQVTAWQANNTFSVYNGSTPQTQSNPDAQLVNGFIGAINSAGGSPTFPAKVTIASIPLSDYSVYVYFNNNNTGQKAQISLTSGTYNSPTYYVSMQGPLTLNGGVYPYTDGSPSTVGTYTASNFVRIPVPAAGLSGTSDSFTVTLSSATPGGNTPGIAAIELVPNAGPVLANSIAVTADSTIDLTGASSAAAGNLSIGSQTLSVTGGSVGPGAPYTMNMGTTTLTGNATFNVSNNGTGKGTLQLGAVSDGGSGFGITVNSSFSSTGTVVLTAGGNYQGPTTVNVGTLRVNGVVSGSGAVTVSNGGTLAGPTTSGTSGSLAGATTVQAGGALSATNGATLAFTGGLALSDLTKSTYDLSGAPNGTADPAFAMIVTSGGSGARSVALGAATTDTHTVNFTGTPSPLANSHYDLLSYTGTALTSAVDSSGSKLTFTDAASVALGTSPPGPFSFQLVNNPSASPNGGGQIDLIVTSYPLSWTGGGSWDTTGQNQNFAAMAPTPFYCAYVDSAIVTFGDKDIVANSVLAPQTITVQSGGVRPASVAFTNTGSANGGTDYTFINDLNPVTGVRDAVGISGSTGIILNGNGTIGGQVTLAAPNSFTGPVQVNLGTLVLSDGAALGSSSGVTVASAAELDLNSTANPLTFGNAVNGTGQIGLTLGTAGAAPALLNNVAGMNTYAGPITVGGTATISSSSATGSLTLSGGVNTGAGGNTLTLAGPAATVITGPISGSGPIVSNSTGTVAVAGTSSYSGGLTVASGTLALGVSSNPAGTGTITLAGGNLQLFGQASGTLRSGLTAAFYNGASTLSTGGADPNLASLPTLISHFSTQTPVTVSQTTAGGMTTLNWPAASSGDPFVAQGFLGTSNYEAVMTGVLVIAQGGNYTFETRSDDGSVLFIDGSSAPQVNNNTRQGSTTKDSLPISLSAGVHTFALGYFEGSPGAQLWAQYQGPDTLDAMTPIPNSALLNTGTIGLPSATQSYANNIAVTSNATVDVNGSLAASVGNLSLTGSALNLTSSDLSTSAYSLSVGSLNVSGASGVNVAASASGGAGTLRVTAPPTFAAGSSLAISAGKVRFTATSGSATVGAGATATVASGATLELAGSTSALSSGANRVNVQNDSSTAGILVSGTNQVVGGIDGAGTTQVNDGSDLTANHIVQSALVIGGTAASPSFVTIAASDENGNPLAEASVSLARLAASNNATVSGPLPPVIAGSMISSISSSDLASVGSIALGVGSNGGGIGGSTAAVPEPSTIILLALGAIGCWRSVRRGKLPQTGAES